MDAEAARLAELAQKIFEGDRKAESELCARITPGIRQILKRRVHDFTLVDDLTQEALLVIILRLRTEPLTDPNGLEAFAMQTARYLAIGHRRKEQRQNTNTGVEFDEVPDPQPDPAVAAEADSTAAAVHAMLQDLNYRDRRVLEMYYLQGKDKASICRELKINENRFNVVLFHARSRLRKLLQKRGLGLNDLL